jgi:hypothetical protein
MNLITLWRFLCLKFISGYHNLGHPLFKPVSRFILRVMIFLTAIQGVEYHLLGI